MNAFHYRSYGTFFLHSKRLHNLHGGFTHYRNYRAFTSRAGIGNTAILGKEATTNQGFQSIVPNPNKLDSYFIYSRTNELKRYGEVTGAGSTFVEVSGKQMSKMPIMIPELSEQEKIGSFFKQLDDTIALHQRKLDLLKEQKKGFLQKMFV